MPITPTTKIWMDGELVDWDKATVHVLTHSLHYGMGVFEGIRAYETADGPAIFRLRDHTKRLCRGARILQMEMPFSEEEIFEAIKLTVAVNGLDSCYIRPIAYLGYGEMGLNPLPCKVSVSIACWPWGAYLGETTDGGCAVANSLAGRAPGRDTDTRLHQRLRGADRQCRPVGHHRQSELEDGREDDPCRPSRTPHFGGPPRL